MSRWRKPALALVCVALALALATTAYATGGTKPVWAGHSFDPEGRPAVKITSATNSASSFAFTWFVWGFTHEPGKGIDWVRFNVNADPTEVKNLTYAPLPGWFMVGPQTVARDHVPFSTGTTGYLNVHFGVTGTTSMQNSESDVWMNPVTVHFAYVSESGGQSTTTGHTGTFTGVGVDHHETSPVEDASWGWVKDLFK